MDTIIRNIKVEPADEDTQVIKKKHIKIEPADENWDVKTGIIKKEYIKVESHTNTETLPSNPTPNLKVEKSKIGSTGTFT